MRLAIQHERETARSPRQRPWRHQHARGVASLDRTLHATGVSPYIRLPKHSECIANIQGHISRHGNCYRRRGRRARNRVTHERTAVKIYSLLCDDCVIYDGRVGAALGLLTRQFCEATGHTEVPSALEFAFGTPKEARNTKNTKVRDPSHGPLRFPRLGPDARFHTVQAMRANWFIGRALNRNPNAFSAGEEGFHELAAGFFMVGYDLRDA